MIPYDHGFRPPAPVVDVEVAHPLRTRVVIQLRGKLDTGADTTVIPSRLVQQLGLASRSSAWLRSYDGTYSRRPLYYVRLQIIGLVLFAVRCASADRETMLLGRNVLNRFVIRLDGKRLLFDIKQ